MSQDYVQCSGKNTDISANFLFKGNLKDLSSPAINKVVTAYTITEPNRDLEMPVFSLDFNTLIDNFKAKKSIIKIDFLLIPLTLRTFPYNLVKII